MKRITYLEALTAFQDFLKENYELRLNDITGKLEIRDLQIEQQHFDELTNVRLNTLLIHAKINGVPFCDQDMKQYLSSRAIAKYNPFREYLGNLPAPDGEDHVDCIGHCLTEKPTLIAAFHVWARAMVAQMMGFPMQTANSFMPILISAKQGMYKTTFCRQLVPPELQAYYTERLDVSEAGHFQEQLISKYLINLDECDMLMTNEKKMASLKNILTMKEPCYRKLFTNSFVKRQRSASFIGTSNQLDILSDPSGSRRVGVYLIEKPLDKIPMNHEQFYAQLKAEVERGELLYLTHEQEEIIQEYNKQFYPVSEPEELFNRCFHLPGLDEPAKAYTAVMLVEIIKRAFPKAASGLKAKALSYALRKVGITPTHTRTGNVFMLVENV